ncbi:hypothetical protein E2C01_069493 [Portunus trituberculatus]|uniref:Uncharacterized protein n=1 Tax=Portunus trituberculatus TaxID=210409 RepID=A0A5B7I2C9_PORTR|nr:hypothetical protein [Portunus trituberculatus]
MGSYTFPFFIYTHTNHFSFNTLSTMTRFHIPSAYYVVILYSFRKSCWGLT